MRVRYTRRALDDLEAVFSIIESDNPAAAQAVKRAIRGTIELLADFPHIGQRVDRSEEFRGIRSDRYPYRIYYRVSGGEIWIVHIRDVRRMSWEGK